MIDTRKTMQMLKPCGDCYVPQLSAPFLAGCSQCGGTKVVPMESLWAGEQAGFAFMAGSADLQQLLARLEQTVAVADRHAGQAIAAGDKVAAMVFAARRSGLAEALAALQQVVSRRLPARKREPARASRRGIA